MKFHILFLAIISASLAHGVEQPEDYALRLGMPRIPVFGRSDYATPSNFYLDSAAGNSASSGKAGFVDWSLKSHIIARQLSEAEKDVTIGEFCRNFPLADDRIDWEKTLTEIMKSDAYKQGFVTVFDTEDDSQKRILFTRGGSVAISFYEWGKTEPIDKVYSVAGSTAARPYRIYATRAEEKNSSAHVSLSGKYVRFFGDPNLITPRYAAGGGTNVVWGLDYNTNTQLLTARYIMLDEATHKYDCPQGQFVLAYYKTELKKEMVSAIVVEIVPPNVNTLDAKVGDELRPIGGGYDVKGLHASVSKGTENNKVNDPYSPYVEIFAANTGEELANENHGKVYAIAPTDESTSELKINMPWKVDIYWKAPDPMGTMWTFENDWYLVRWPKEEAIRVVQSGDPRDPGYPWQIPTNYTVRAEGYYRAPKSMTVSVDASTGKVIAGTQGSYLLKLTTADNKRPFYIPVESRYRTSSEVCDSENIIDWPVAKEIGLRMGVEAGKVEKEAARMDESLPGYIHVAASEGRNWDPRLYHSPVIASSADTRTEDEKDSYEKLESAIYGVNSSEKPIEVWWSGKVLGKDLPVDITYPGLVQRYRVSWDDLLIPGLAPEIALSSGQGSGDKEMTAFVGRSLFLTTPQSTAAVAGKIDLKRGMNATNTASFAFSIYCPKDTAPNGRLATLKDGASTISVDIRPATTPENFVIEVNGAELAEETNKWEYACAAWQNIAIPMPSNGYSKVTLSLGATDKDESAAGVFLDDIMLWHGADKTSPAETNNCVLCYSFSDKDLRADAGDTNKRTADAAIGSAVLTCSDCSFAGAGAPGPYDGHFHAEGNCRPAIYVQNDKNAIGYNPNEEHAFMTINGSDYIAWALRNDLNVVTNENFSSHPFVLVEYPKNGKGAMQAFKVVTQNAAHPKFEKTVVAGSVMLPPNPIGLVEGSCTKNDSSYSLVSTNDAALVYKDRKNQMWARRGDAKAQTHYSYPMQAGFYCPSLKDTEQLPAGTLVGWMNCEGIAKPTTNQLTNAETSKPWTWSSTWPENPKTMKIGQVLTVAEHDLPEVWNAASMAVIYPNPAKTNDTEKVVEMIDPTVAQTAPLAIKSGDFPSEYGFTLGNSGTCFLRKGKYYFRNCPPSVSDRFYVDTNADESKRMNLIGDRVVKEAGGSYLRLNVLTPEEREQLLKLCPLDDATDAKKRWIAAVNALATKQVVPVTRGNLTPQTVDTIVPFVFTLPRGGEYVEKLLKTFKDNYTVMEVSGVQIKSTLDDNDRSVNRAHYVSHSISYMTIPEDSDAYKNAKSEYEKNIQKKLCGDKSWSVKTHRVFGVVMARDVCVLTVNMRITTARTSPTLEYGPKDHLALVATGDGAGWVTLIENDNPDPAQVSTGLPVSVKVIKVLPEMYVDGIAVVPDALNKLSEQLTLLYRTPLGDAANNFEFEWRRARPYLDGTLEKNKNQNPPWSTYGEIAAGKYSVLLGAGGIKPDDYVNTYYTLRIRPKENTMAFKTIAEGKGIKDPKPEDLWSAWADEQLAEGWLQRVLNAVTPFAQRVEDFYANPSDIGYTMMEQIGRPYQGDVALNNDNLREVGLLELYQTLFNRVEMLLNSLDAEDVDLSKQLLLAQTRLGEFYTLLGGEAYSDAKNPLIQCADGESYPAGTFSFANQVPTLLDEELALLRGRSNLPAFPRHTEAPLYNRLAWNLTKGLTEGEAAYVNNYGIRARNGVLDVNCAAAQYPQGHGDAWGHYLSALKGYYRLLRNPKFKWAAAMGEMLMDQKLTNVDYQDEQKFADAALKLAQVGHDAFDLTLRKAYRDNGGNTEGAYFDTDANQAFGCADWASRAEHAALYGWLTANALLPTTNTAYQAFTDRGIMKIDRTTATQLPVICQVAADIERGFIAYEAGLNPLGLSEDAIPFDIDPDRLAEKNTHFEQILERAEKALANCETVLDYANVYGARMRQIQKDETEAIDERAKTELSYQNQLIAIYGTPFSDDIGPGKTYPQGYEGPDLYNYNYMDLSVYGLAGIDTAFTNSFKLYYAPDNGTLGQYKEKEEIASINYIATPGGIRMKPENIKGARATEGTIQTAYRDYILAYQALQGAIIEYDVKKNAMDASAASTREAIAKSIVLSAATIAKTYTDIYFDLGLFDAQSYRDEVYFSMMDADHNQAYLEGLNVFGTANLVDMRPLLKDANDAVLAPKQLSLLYTYKTKAAVNSGIGMKKLWSSGLKTVLDTGWEWASTIRDLGKAFAASVEEVNNAALSVQSKVAALATAEAEYRAQVYKGDLIQSERELWRKQLSNKATASRYADMFNRVQHNLALTKYSTTFDTAQRYVWELAKVYDYETGLLSSDPKSGKQFLADIVATRSLGEKGVSISSGTTDGGLYDVVNRMKANWDVLKPRLGMNNPDKPAKWFSLRHGLFRIRMTADGDEAWQKELAKYRVDDIRKNENFIRYCQPQAMDVVRQEPGYIITFSTSINGAENFFGHPLIAGDSQFSAADYATKIDAVGVDFVGYDAATGATDGYFAVEPNIYLVPVGEDVMRAPAGTDNRKVLSWNVVDQVMPLPYTIGSTQLDDVDWVSTFAGLGGKGSEAVTIRRHSTMRMGNTFTSNRLVGRSAWNTKWMLVIPASSLNAQDPKVLDRFAEKVSDIKFGIKAYSRSGN